MSLISHPAYNFTQFHIPIYLWWSVKLEASSCFRQDNSINTLHVLEQKFISHDVFRIAFVKQKKSIWSDLIAVNQIIKPIMNRNESRTTETMSIFFKTSVREKLPFSVSWVFYAVFYDENLFNELLGLHFNFLFQVLSGKLKQAINLEGRASSQHFPK